MFRGNNEIPKPNHPVAMSIPSPCKTTVFKPKESGRKPKGLSIRSNSDMNVFHSTRPTNIKENTHNFKELDFLKSNPKRIKLDSSGHQTYSLKEHWMHLDYEHQIAKFEKLSLKEETICIDKKRKIEEDDEVFKKPLPHRRFVKQIREPESLAHFYDAQHKFDHEYIENIDQEFMDQFLKGKENMIPYEEKDSEILLPVEIPKLILPSSFDEECIGFSSSELSYISNDDL